MDKNSLFVKRKGNIFLINNKKITPRDKDYDSSGASHVRIVKFIGEYVLKIDRKDEYVDHCEKEVLFYKNEIEKDDKKYFQPPIKHGKHWIVQKKIKFKRGKRPKWAYEIIYKLEKKYGKWDFTNSGNWGIKEDDGQPILFDYGL